MVGYCPFFWYPDSLPNPLYFSLCKPAQCSNKKKISFRCAFTLFHLSNITRYLPGRIWGVVRLLSLSHRFGLRKTVVGSSLTLHVSIEAALGGLIASSLLFSGQIRATAPEVLEKVPGHTLFLILPVVGLLIGILFLIFKVTKQVWTSVKKCLHLLGKAPLWRNVISCHVLLWGCQGLAFFLFIRSFSPVAWTEAAVLTACYAFAWIVGFLSFLTPGGLGVREGLLSLLLASYMPLSQATLVALFYRVWILSTEIILAGVALFLYKKRG
ncbi:MAG: lysylphosphatidylglycerol synthase domain-containing protein [Candidatus Poribacteria bacterium]|nr:lysylphosphatidylglycerol synthase domain-containing protein [Candidatus Poribacteria bacterium]